MGISAMIAAREGDASVCEGSRSEREGVDPLPALAGRFELLRLSSPSGLHQVYNTLQPVVCLRSTGWISTPFPALLSDDGYSIEIRCRVFKKPNANLQPPPTSPNSSPPLWRAFLATFVRGERGEGGESEERACEEN